MLGYLEVDIMLGIEIIIGLFGQGIVNVVGYVVFGKMVEVCFNIVEYKIFDNYIIVFVGDGCMQEGVVFEVVVFVGY